MKGQILSEGRSFARFDPEGVGTCGTPLPELCGELLTRQKASWPKLRSGWEAAASSQTRTVDCGDFLVALQFNPQRIVSSGARVDAASIAARPCFLCPDNLPEAQSGILYRKKFLVLCNPFPIFSRHFTISSLDHRPQFLEGELEVFLALARDLAPSLAVFYNGPQCGASAPDHLHFQACPVGSLPVEAQQDDGRPAPIVGKRLSASVSQIENLGRAALRLEGTDAPALMEALEEILAVMKAFPAAEGTAEPMLNLHAAFAEGKWRVLLFPRRKNRPDLYDREEPERVLISPGGVEMGGLFVVPLERDFRRLNADLIRHIYREVSVTSELMDTWIDQLSKRLG